MRPKALITLLAMAAMLLWGIPARAVQTSPVPQKSAKTAPAPAATDDEDDEEEIINEEEEPADENENPEEREGDLSLLADADIDDDIDIAIPSFIDQRKNRIQLNGANWTQLYKAVNAHKINPLSIVNIGDSHIQANFGTAVTRELLQYRYGNAGRGIITPLKMSGTNQPNDYTFSSNDPYTSVKLMKAPWKKTMGFTGTSISPTTTQSTITVGTRSDDDYDPFSSLTLFHRGQMKINRITDERGVDILFTQHPSRDFTFIKLSSPQTRVTINYDNLGDLTIFGASLSGDRPGAFFHSIGNNGATYDTYNRIGGMGASLKALNPDLVILSLGTNEAFGRLDTARFRQSVDRLVKDIKASNPKAQILLVTPMECHRSVTKTVTKKVTSKGKRTKSGKRRKGGSRVVTQKVRTSGINTNIKPIRDAILEYGRDNHIAVYDLWEVAGGAGSSDVWIKNGLFSRDKIHHSLQGYRLEGRLLYDALVDAFNQK